MQNWGYVREVFGEEFWFRFAPYPPSIDLRPIWNDLCAFADEYSLPRSEAIAFLESNKNDKEMLGVNILGFLDRTMPKSRLLLDYCKLALEQGGGNSSYISDEARFATELLGKHFAEDRDVLAWLMTLAVGQGQDVPRAKKVIPEKLILALCEGWVESEEFKRVCDSLKQSKQPLTWSTFFHLSSRVTQTEKLFESFIDYLPRVERSEHLRYEVVARPLARRLKKDNALLRLLVARLQATPTLSEKTSVPRLIAIAKGSAEVRQWCIEELEKQTNGSTFPEVGVDLVKRELQPVAHSLLELLT